MTEVIAETISPMPHSLSMADLEYAYKINTEFDLIKAAQTGDQPAFSALYQMHAPTIIGIAARRTGDPIGAEDIAQVVLLNTWRRLSEIKDLSSGLHSYLVRSAHNLMTANGRRKSAQLNMTMAPEDMPEPSLGTRPLDTTVAARLDAQAELARLKAALKPDMFAALINQEWGMSDEELAFQAGSKLATIRTRRHRARKEIEKLEIIKQAS